MNFHAGLKLVSNNAGMSCGLIWGEINNNPETGPSKYVDGETSLSPNYA
jgi:hypothetical protein